MDKPNLGLRVRVSTVSLLLYFLLKTTYDRRLYISTPVDKFSISILLSTLLITPCNYILGMVFDSEKSNRVFINIVRRIINSSFLQFLLIQCPTLILDLILRTYGSTGFRPSMHQHL